VTDNLSATPRCDDLAIIGYKNKLGACGIPGIGFITGYGCTIDGNAPGSSSVDKKNIFKEGDNLGCHLDTDQGTIEFYKNTQVVAKVKYPQNVNLRASVSLWGQQTIELRTLSVNEPLVWQ